MPGPGHSGARMCRNQLGRIVPRPHFPHFSNLMHLKELSEWQQGCTFYKSGIIHHHLTMAVMWCHKFLAFSSLHWVESVKSVKHHQPNNQTTKHGLIGLIKWSRSAFPIYADSFLAILAAHFDFRKHFEPELRARCISLAKQKQVTKDADGWF